MREEVGVRNKTKITLDTTLREDLGCDGDDGPEFLEAFFQEFGVTCDRFELRRYFNPEGNYIPGMTPLLYRLANGKPYPHHPPPDKDVAMKDLVRAAEKGVWIDAW